MENIEISVRCKECNITKNVTIYKEMLNFTEGGIVKFRLPPSKRICVHDIWVQLDENFDVRDTYIADYEILIKNNEGRKKKKKKRKKNPLKQYKKIKF